MKRWNEQLQSKEGNVSLVRVRDLTVFPFTFHRRGFLFGQRGNKLKRYVYAYLIF